MEAEWWDKFSTAKTAHYPRQRRSLCLLFVHQKFAEETGSKLITLRTGGHFGFSKSIESAVYKHIKNSSPGSFSKDATVVASLLSALSHPQCKITNTSTPKSREGCGDAETATELFGKTADVGAGGDGEAG